MNKRLARAAALSALVGWASIAPQGALAQLPGGSLIVNISSPASGSTVSGTIPVTASVSIVGSLTVAGVQFRLDGANLGAEDTSSPYSVSWNTTTASPGSHTLTAVARDSLGQRFTSNPVTVTVANDTTAPTVTLNQAAAQADPTSASPINFTVVFSEPVSGFTGSDVAITGTAGGTKTRTVTGGPSTYNVAVSGMTSSGTVIATVAAGLAQDAAGNTNTASTSTDNSVTFDATAPTVTITSPAAGASVFGTITVTASASDSVGVVGVRFFGDGSPLGAEDTTAPYSVSFNTATTSNGSHTLTAVARDAAGNRTTSAPVAVTVDNVAPTVTINQAAAQADPTNAAPINFTVVFSEPVSGFTGSDVAITGTAGGTKTRTVTGGPSTYNVAVSGMTSAGTVSAALAAGVAQDAAGNTNTASTSTDNSVSFDAAAPTVTITSPATGASVSGTITVTASASDSVGVVGVQFFGDGSPLGAEDTTAPYSVSFNTATTSNGSHTLTAVARDAAGNRTTSAPVAVTVENDTTPPTVSITSPAAGATVSGVVSVTASATDAGGVSLVQFLVDGVELAQDTTAPYEAAWDTRVVANGTHTLQARAQDTAGNIGASAVLTVTVANDTTAPTVSITSPASGTTVSGPIIVMASASDNSGVAGVRFFVGTVEIGVEDTTVPYEVSWNTTTLSDGFHTLIAVARDADGNTASSTGITVTVSNGGPGVTRFEEDNPALSASPASAWVRRGPEVAAFSDGTAGSSDVAEATVTFTFTGTAASWIGLKCNICGIATVSIDGGAPISVDTAGAAAIGSPGLASEVVFTSPTLAAGTHTLVITVTGNTTSGGAHILVDAFDVTGNPTGSAVNRFEETNAAVSAAGAWVQRCEEIATFSGGCAGSSDAAGDSVTFTFTGTAVSLIGLKCSVCGIANVSIDGAAAGLVDTTGAAAPGSPGLASEPVFTASGLAAGAHTLVITVTGTTTSGGAHIIIDAFDVTP